MGAVVPRDARASIPCALTSRLNTFWARGEDAGDDKRMRFSRQWEDNCTRTGGVLESVFQSIMIGSCRQKVSAGSEHF